MDIETLLEEQQILAATRKIRYGGCTTRWGEWEAIAEAQDAKTKRKLVEWLEEKFCGERRDDQLGDLLYLRVADWQALQRWALEK